MRRYLFLVLFLLSFACQTTQPKARGPRFGSHTESSLRFKDLGTERAVRRGIMGRASESERVPSQLEAPSLVEDAALLTTLGPRVCMEMTLNTQGTYDAPSQSLEPTCEVDGRDVGVDIVEERARQAKYWYEVPAGLFEKKDRVFIVTTRLIQLCCPAKATNHIKLSVENKLLGADIDKPWSVFFEWSILPE